MDNETKTQQGPKHEPIGAHIAPDACPRCGGGVYAMVHRGDGLYEQDALAAWALDEQRRARIVELEIKVRTLEEMLRIEAPNATELLGLGEAGRV